MNVSELVGLLGRHFPLEDAEPWDRPGLSVGDPTAEVRRVACALDATPDTVRQAHARGCEVLVTHHPVFLDPPFPVTPQVRTSGIGGATLWAAATLGVSLVAMHTNLDRSDAALELCAELVGLPRTGRLQEPHGYGALMEAGSLTTGQLARRCERAFGGTPVVWGADDTRPGTVAFCSGSLGSFGTDAIARGVGLVITGEAGYHRLSELACAGVEAILLGHDASEFPYAGLLARTIGAEAPDTSIEVLDEGLRWHAWARGE